MKLCVLLIIIIFIFATTTHIPNTIIPEAQKLSINPLRSTKLYSKTKYGTYTKIILCHVPKKNQDQKTLELKSLL